MIQGFQHVGEVETIPACHCANITVITVGNPGEAEHDSATKLNSIPG
jgi:hypothetical protein